MGDQWGEIGELNFIGDVHRDRSDDRKATAYYAASLEANAEGILAAVIDSLEGLAAVAAAQRRFRRVAMLAGVVGRIRYETGRADSQSITASFESACVAARASLGDLLFDETSKLGAEASLANAIETARKG